jgi:hypothetical protein
LTEAEHFTTSAPFKALQEHERKSFNGLNFRKTKGDVPNENRRGESSIALTSSILSNAAEL